MPLDMPAGSRYTSISKVFKIRMNTDDKARRFVDFLQMVTEKAEHVDKDNLACCEKVSPQEMRVLRTIGREQCCIMSGIANAIRLSLSSATGLIDRLVEKKLVRRDRSNEDRRVVQVELTPEGKELHEASTQGRVEFARELLQTLSPAEQAELVKLFGTMTERIGRTKKA